MTGKPDSDDQLPARRMIATEMLMEEAFEADAPRVECAEKIHVSIPALARRRFIDRPIVEVPTTLCLTTLQIKNSKMTSL